MLGGESFSAKIERAKNRPADGAEIREPAPVVGGLDVAGSADGERPQRTQIDFFGVDAPHLTERLSGAEDGKPKVFRDSAINNLSEFFERFRSLNVRSNEDLDNLVVQAQRVVRGVAPQTLRDDGSIRERVTNQLSAVQASLDGLMVDRPRRRIIRNDVGEE